VTAARRFPPPWSAEAQEACFVVRDHTTDLSAHLATSSVLLTRYNALS